MKKNSIVFKGRNDGIIVMLSDDIPFEKLKKDLEIKLIDAKGFFNDAKAAIKFDGRNLTDDEESELIDIIKNGSGLDITFVGAKTAKSAVIREIARETLNAMENMTYYHRGSIRSGQEIHYSGSVVVIGDVNPGGEIIAEGNVIVIGALKGLVHAGCKGAEGCFVLSSRMIPTQLRIADIITYVPEHMKKGRARLLEYAYIQDGKIYIETLE